MKTKIIIILLTIISLTNFKLHKDKIYVFSIINGKEIIEEKILYQEISTTLTNNSKSELHYASMSCSYLDLYFMGKQVLFFDPIKCDKNIPKVITLKPGESKTEIIRLRKSAKLIYDEVKIAFNLIQLKTKDEKFDINLIETPNKNNLIWSNSVSFEK